MLSPQFPVLFTHADKLILEISDGQLCVNDPPDEVNVAYLLGDENRRLKDVRYLTKRC